MSMFLKTVILLFQCNDKKGIVAKISDFLYQHDANIITADQYSTDPEGGHFFFRVEFCLDESQHNKKELEESFLSVAEECEARWSMHYKDQPLRMGILVSRPDHCLVDLLYLWKSGELQVSIPYVVSNYREHEALVASCGIPFYFVGATKKDKKEREILDTVSDTSDFLVLARYMQILSAEFIETYGKDIINIHHSFLPSFKGANPYKQAFEHGVKVIGATAHFVNEHLDEGPIISQVVEPVSHKDSVADLMRKGKNLEKRALSQALHSYCDYRIIQYKSKTIVF